MRGTRSGEGAFGDAELGEDGEGVEELGGGLFAAKEALVFVDEVFGVLEVLVEKLDAVVGEAGAAEFVVEAGSGLGAAVEEGVATADVGGEAVQLTHAVAQVNDVFFAGIAAVLLARSFAEKGAKDAVLHVEEGHVLVEGELEPLGRGLF